MFLRARPDVLLQPKFFSSLKNTRSLRPSIKICKDKFQLCVDVQHFNKDEIRVKAHPEYVTVEGKHEKHTHQGYVLRQFIRKFKLPDGCDPSKIKCMLCPDGMLTVEAQRSLKDLKTPADAVVVPISYGWSQSEKEDDKIETEPSQVYVHPCNNYPKVKPKTEKK